MRRIVSLLVWFALLEGLWALVVGTQQDTELVAGFGAAALGAIFAEVLRTKGLLPFSTDFGTLGKAWKLSWQLVLDFGILTRAALRPAGPRGEWVEAPYPTAEGGRGNWQRAFAAVVGTATPNAIVVDLDDGRALLHSLDPRVSSGREPL